MRLRVDAAQMRWLRNVLAKAKRDGVKWIIAQGHTPILWPVRTRGSSGLHYGGGAKSELWQVFKKYGVDLYLAGEVHDVTAEEQDGITQITHGGAFQYGLTNYLVLDITDDLRLPDAARLRLRALRGRRRQPAVGDPPRRDAEEPADLPRPDHHRHRRPAPRRRPDPTERRAQAVEALRGSAIQAILHA